ncbi:MAG: hypothetical protein GY817_03725 [bacterium]|nr:hypothetical protein [bacterium]
MDKPIRLRSKLSDTELEVLDAEVAEVAAYRAAVTDAEVAEYKAKAVLWRMYANLYFADKAKADRLKSKQQEDES